MRRTSLALLWLAALSVACSGLRVRTDYDPELAFGAYQSYAWIDPPLREAPRAENALPTDPFTHNTLVDKRVRDEVDAALARRGFRRAADGESPDFLVRYELVSREVTRDAPVFVSGGFGGYHRHHHHHSGIGYLHTTTYQEGTLILDVIDPATQRIAWRGWAVSRTRDEQFEPPRLSKAVAVILERFPPEPPHAPADGEPTGND